MKKVEAMDRAAIVETSKMKEAAQRKCCQQRMRRTLEIAGVHSLYIESSHQHANVERLFKAIVPFFFFN